MGYTLYGAPGYGSMVVEAALAELDQDYEFLVPERTEDGAFAASYLSINPRGQMPSLKLPDGSIVTETSAILSHLADAFPDAHLAPPPGSSARAQHDRWLNFLHTNVYEGILRSGYSDRYVSHPAAAQAVHDAADAYVLRHFKIFEDAIRGPFALGDQITMLDLYVWMFAQWVDQAPLAAQCPKLTELRARVASRPAIIATAARNPV